MFGHNYAKAHMNALHSKHFPSNRHVTPLACCNLGKICHFRHNGQLSSSDINQLAKMSADKEWFTLS